MTFESTSKQGNERREQHGFSPLMPESEGFLALAQEAGRLGVFEWKVQAGTLRVSANFLSLYGLSDFDGKLSELGRLRFSGGPPAGASM